VIARLLVLAVAAMTLAATGGAAREDRRMALTFDDLPGVVRPSTLAALEDVNARLLAPLRIGRVPAAGFVNEQGLDVEGEREARIALLRSWLDAGMTLGNHTYAHRGINDTPLEEYQADVLRGERVTRRLLATRGATPVWFRHPYTHTGPTAEVRGALERFLASQGYRIAPFTIENADYAFAAVYDRLHAAGDEDGADRVMAAYLDYTDAKVAWAEALALDTFGRPIPHVLLAHVNRLNADGLPELLRRLRARGYAFVSLDEALTDAAYRTPDGYIGRYGPSWLHRWRAGLGQPSAMKDEPDPPDWVLERFRSSN
jgi:peptidoglycan/xylan/chitin deacetylase (PgdA/CDA1 family)